MANSDAVYDIEMQAIRQASLGKRFRFYQSVIDSRALAPSEGFSELRKSLVAFICLYDPLKAGCSDIPSRRHAGKAACDLKSSMEWLVLNAKAWDKAPRQVARAVRICPEGQVREPFRNCRCSPGSKGRCRRRIPTEMEVGR